MIKLSMVQMLINLTFVKVITQVMINIVLLFASPVLPVIESFESLQLTQSLTDNQQSYNEIIMISKSSWKIHQLKPLSAIKSTINSKRPKQQHVDTYLKLSTRKQSADDQSTITTKASGEMLPSSPGNNSLHGNVLINQSTVFLGGSCNPTTWRKDIAIPMLKALNITYYDPQKDHWEPELIELEDKAKKNSQVLFFVIDNQTRSIASMIEVSFIAATTKKLVLVIDLFPSLEPIINGEPISQYEHDILKGGRKLLMKLVERKGMPVFNQIPAALNYIPIMISRNQTIKSKIKVNCPQLDDKCDNCDEIDSQREPQQLKDSLNNNLTDSQRIKTADIYLGGSDNPKGWRSSIAIPLIDQSNLTYSMPNINRWDTTGNDLTKLESCQVLLFVIGGQRPELETMILATHYFGQKFKVVLCVQPMPLESVAQDNQISMAAIDDYNRGRAYLSEIARKENIEVFEDLEEAVKCAIKSAKSSAN
ncbi:uncharacterized protein LOC128393905 isoform X3 [Panonychus citri]|uniref:uncharacterized protein LOC128393905 isoform X3 n=1 Tax=Panonychus citri TaxID=50023 RepID=UPI002308177B|nr:uncharacterized protein LOC128393905 isoform X3 [Panonychus citri]